MCGICILLFLALIILACFTPWWFTPLFIVLNLIVLFVSGSGNARCSVPGKTQRRFAIGCWIVIGAFLLGVIGVAVYKKYAWQIDEFLSSPKEEVYVGDGKAPNGTNTENKEKSLVKKEDKDMITLVAVIIGVMICLIIVMFMGRHKNRNGDESDRKNPQRASEQECENGDRTPDSQDEVRRRRNFYDDVQHRDYTDYDRIRAAKAERDAYDDFIASLDMDD